MAFVVPCRTVIAPIFLVAQLTAAPGWRSLAIEPQEIVLAAPGASQRFVVSASDAAGRELDVAEDARVVSSNPRVAEIDREHRTIVGKAPGRATVKVTLGGRTAFTSVEVRNQPADVTVHFSPDVISILTTKGCNGSGCHGSPAGQNGFKLSLFGYNLDADHEMIVRAQNGRRVNLQNPEESLLLKKPSFRVPHGGGRVLPADSEEYRTILKWLRQGATLDTGGVRITRLELYPRERTLPGMGVRQNLAVIGRLSDGSTRDMSREVRYMVVDEAVAGVTPAGVLTSSATGLTAVLARAMGQVAAAQFGVISARAEDASSWPAENNFIDRLVFSKLRKMNIAPYPVSSDSEFVRRVYLDTIGTLPTPAEVSDFAKDSAPGKRARLIDRLLKRPEYARSGR